MTNQLLPYGTGLGANVLSFGAYRDLAARLLGFTAGTASSQAFNTAMRQAAFAAAMLGEFTSLRSGEDVLDDGNVAAFAANFEAALAAVIKETGINVGSTPPEPAFPGMLWLNTGTVTFHALNDYIPPLGLAAFTGAGGWVWISGGRRTFNGVTGAAQAVLTFTDTTAILSGISPPWGSYNAQNGKLTSNVAGELELNFNAQLNVSYSSAPEPGQKSALLTGFKKNGAWVCFDERPSANAGFEEDGVTTGYIFEQSVSFTDVCAKGDVYEPVFYLWDGGTHVSSAITMAATSFRAARLS